MQIEQYRELYDLIKDAFIEMQSLVNSSEEQHKLILSQYDFPKFDNFQDNGMPRLSTYFPTSGPKDYASLFSSHGERYYYYEDISSFKKILNYFKNHLEDFKSHPYYSYLSEDNVNMYSRLLSADLLETFDCYMHGIESKEFNEDIFKTILYRLFSRIFKTALPISICIPILLIRFEKDEMTITDNIRIRRLTKKEMISCYGKGGYSDTYELLIVSSATHILELQNYSVNNGPIFSNYAWGVVDAYPVDMIDRWFAAFRIVTQLNTGYGQILCFPDDWGIRKGNLIDIHGVKIKKYPYSFIKNRKDIDPTPLVTIQQLEKVIKLFQLLNESKSNSMNIAIKRLTMAYLREEEQDSIIDLIIGIEALVTKEDHNEITHKVSIRTALILSTLPRYPYSITKTFSIMKKLYGFRSKVVHGANISDKQRVIELQENESIPSVELAGRILEYLILAMAYHPEYLDTTKIDTMFLDQYEAMLKAQIVEGQ